MLRIRVIYITSPSWCVKPAYAQHGHEEEVTCAPYAHTTAHEQHDDVCNTLEPVTVQRPAEHILCAAPSGVSFLMNSLSLSLSLSLLSLPYSSVTRTLLGLSLFGLGRRAKSYNAFSIVDCVLCRMCSQYNVFFIECVFYRLCFLKTVFS